MKFSLLFLLAVFAYCEVERLLPLGGGSAFFAYIQIHVMVLGPPISYLETPSHGLGNSHE